MSIDHRRRSLLLLMCLSPLAQASPLLALRPADGPVDLIRRVFDEVLTSPRQRAAVTRMQGR